jgi:CheY-like chemotaxis protein
MHMKRDPQGILSHGYRTLRILVVDDIPHARKLLRGVLAHAGLRQVIECGSREAAFDAVCLENPDIVITDWEMPGGSGLQLIRDIRLDPRSPDPTLPVLLLTAHGGREQVREGRDAGATDFLVKPFTSEAIAIRIKDVVNRQRLNVITPDYRGPDRRRVQRPVAVDRRAGVPQEVLVLPADGLLKAKISGDPTAIEIARAKRAETAGTFQKSAPAAASHPASAVRRAGEELARLIKQALAADGRWPELLAAMGKPLAALLRTVDGGLTPMQVQVAQQLQGFTRDIANAVRDPELLRLVLMTMAAMLRIGVDPGAEAEAMQLAGQIEALHRLRQQNR